MVARGMDVRRNQHAHHRKHDDEDDREVPEQLGDRRVTEERHDELDEHSRHDQRNLEAGADRHAFVGEHRLDDEHDEHKPFDLEPDLGDPIEQRWKPVAEPTKGRPAHTERSRARERPLQRRETKEREEHIADDDRQHCLSERQTERNDERAVDEVFDVPDAASPHPEQVCRPHGSLRLRDELDTS